MRSLWLPDMDWVGDRRTVNVAVVGDILHGKTSLVASLVRAQHERLGVPLPALPAEYFDPINLALGGDYASTASGTSVPTATVRRVLNLIDCPGGTTGLTEAIRLVGMADGVVLVVSAEHGVTTHTRNMAHAASRAGVRHLIGFVNLRSERDFASRWCKELSGKSSAGMADNVEVELRHLLIDAGYPGDDLPILRGETWQGQRANRFTPPEWIEQVLFAIETELPTPLRDDEAPLLLLRSDDNYLRDTGREFDYAVDCVVRRGVLHAGTAVEFVAGQAAGQVAHVHTIRCGNRTTNEALPGDIVTAVFRMEGPNRPALVPCHALVEPGSCRVAHKLVARLTVLTEAQGGRRRGMPSGMCPRFSLGTAVFRAPIVMASPSSLLNPGQTSEVEIETSSFGYSYGPKGLLFEPGQGFVCRDHRRVIAVGEIVAMIE